MERQTVVRVAVSLVVLGACAFVLVSLVTFARSDLAMYQLPPASPVHNGGGIVGANLAAWLLESVGWCAALVMALAVGWSVLNLLGRGLEQVVARVLGGLLLLACACTFASAGGGATSSMPGYGGSVGVALGDVVVRYFGEAGQWLLGVPLTLVALLMLSVDELLAPPAVAVARRARGALARLLPRKKRRRAGTRKAAADADTAALPVAADAPLVHEIDETQDVTETAETLDDDEDDARDTGRPVTTGYLGGVKQVGRDAPGATALDDDDEAPTEDELALEDLAEPAPDTGAVPATYRLPTVSLLDETDALDRSVRSEHVQQQIEVLERTLREFNIGAQVVDIDQGPVVTRYELTLDAGTKLSRVTSLSDDLAIATKAPAVRIVAPIPGKSTIGVELPNMEKELVRMRELITSSRYRGKKYTIALFLGKDASGRPIIGDLTKMPHLLIAGATNSGKSVCINSIICSVLMTQHPDDVRLILIDPKVVELSAYAALPHLLTPVVTDMKRAAWILDWACRTMDERYDTLAAVGARSIAAYNRLGEEEIRARIGEDADYSKVPFHLPYIIIIVDELADLMMLAAKNIETSITRLAQKSRAVGLHIILATQRPSVDVVTGLIKSNLPTRISFQVTSKVDSRTILDRNGADTLLGCGDMLFLAPGSSSLIRAQGTFLSDEEIHGLVGFVKAQRKPDFSLNLDGAASDGVVVGANFTSIFANGGTGDLGGSGDGGPPVNECHREIKAIATDADAAIGAQRVHNRR